MDISMGSKEVQLKPEHVYLYELSLPKPGRFNFLSGPCFPSQASHEYLEHPRIASTWSFMLEPGSRLISFWGRPGLRTFPYGSEKEDTEMIKILRIEEREIFRSSSFDGCANFQSTGAPWSDNPMKPWGITSW